jgi:phenylalanyl-tRNA synthetase beta chain
MKIPLAWLKEYLPTKLSDEEIATKLTALGLEFEGMAQKDVLEIALTPNLIHCANIRGMARALAAVTGEVVYSPSYTVIEKKGSPIQQHISIKVEQPTDCPRYSCRLITGVRISPSPAWLKMRIEQCGMRSINNVVDVTNLVLLEFGHPLHAFDYDCIEGKQLVVRKAHDKESITTLDGICRYPTPETLLICDAAAPIAIAGVMGSLNSEVKETTTAILLEAAYFSPSQIRRTSKRMEIRTEASYRFERGCDPNGPLEALERATAWICEIAGGVALEGYYDVKSQDFAPSVVSCRLSQINRVLGTCLARGEVEEIFRRLSFTLAHLNDDLLSVKIPTYRVDIHQEIDLIEEVARLYGYDHIHGREASFFRTGTLPHSPEYLLTRSVRSLLLREGLQECATCDLISPTQAGLISTHTFPSRTLIKLLNPHSAEQSVMRPSLLPGLLNVVCSNTDHGIESIGGFEVGRVHFTAKDKYYEPPVAAIILSGDKTPYHWETKHSKIDFFDLKGMIENLLSGLKISSFMFQLSHYPDLHPGRQATLLVGNIEAGILGEVHPSTLEQIGLTHRVYYAEINLQDLVSFIPTELHMKPLPLFPPSTRDVTLSLPAQTAVGELLNTIAHSAPPLLEEAFILDIYKNPEQAGIQNVTFRLIYRSPDKTLSQAEVESAHLNIIKNLSSQGGSP